MAEVEKWFHSILPQDVNTIRDNREDEEHTLKGKLVRKGMTALHYAAFYCKHEIVKFLLDNDAGECLVHLQSDNVCIIYKVIKLCDLL